MAIIIKRIDSSSDLAGDITPKPLDGNMYGLTQQADVLGKYDNFASLHIPLGAYQKDKDTGIYGIPLDKKGIHRQGCVITERQEAAARRFLAEFRGFGMLADPVGSGKTFEACVILSELVERGNDSVLIIVPNDELKITWKKVLEIEFGLGKDVLIDIGTDEDCPILKKEDKGAYIITSEEWQKQQAEFYERSLFKVVIVDEAHNLIVEGKEKSPLYYLSKMMLTKKEAGFPFCLLLTATPHSGNLDKMFDLWYFLYNKGGNPADFIGTNANKSKEYEVAKHRYEELLHGAHTVAEFIDIDQEAWLTSDVYANDFTDEKGKRIYYQAFDSLSATHYEELTDDTFLRLDPVARKLRCKDFLETCTNSSDAKKREIGGFIQKKVAEDYYRFIRTVMIRQKRSIRNNMRTIHTFLYLPLHKALPEIGNAQKTQNVVKSFFVGKNAVKGEAWLDIACHAVQEEENADDGQEESYFLKKGSSGLYEETFGKYVSESSENKELHLEAVYGESDYEKQIFEKKCAQFAEIAKRHQDERILVFFDYEKNDISKEGKKTWDAVKEYLQKNGESEVIKRIIDGVYENIHGDAVSRYNAKEDAILFAEYFGYTEGMNLQAGHIVVNFEVEPDPLTLDQRIGRVDRLGQKKQVTVYSFADMNGLDGYCLAYFLSVGLLDNVNGDATIIAGSNNEKRMVLRCPGLNCGNVIMVSEESYQKSGKNIPCSHCSGDGFGRRYKMEVIATAEYKCTECGRRLWRPAGGQYGCFSKSETKKMALVDDYDEKNETHVLRCDPICSIRHCRSLVKIGCILTKTKQGKNGETEYEVSEKRAARECQKCYLSYGNNPPCVGINKDTCRLEKNADSCLSCSNTSCRPFKLIIDEKTGYNSCPFCRGLGIFKQVRQRTFRDFARRLFDFNENKEAFCKFFGKEVISTTMIKRILDMDEESNN